MRLVSSCVIVLGLSACLPSMRDTNYPASPSTFQGIADKAQKEGLKAEYSAEGSRDGAKFWYTKVQQDGGTIYYTQNNSTKKVAFTCSGGSLEDSGACEKAGLAHLP